MLFSALWINFLTMLPPILPASFEDISPLYPFFKLTPTSIGVKNIFEKQIKQSPKIHNYTENYTEILNKAQKVRTERILENSKKRRNNVAPL